MGSSTKAGAPTGTYLFFLSTLGTKCRKSRISDSNCNLISQPVMKPEASHTQQQGTRQSQTAHTGHGQAHHPGKIFHAPTARRLHVERKQGSPTNMMRHPELERRGADVPLLARSTCILSDHQIKIPSSVSTEPSTQGACSSVIAAVGSRRGNCCINFAKFVFTRLMCC